jgi:hypothetical protein
LKTLTATNIQQQMSQESSPNPPVTMVYRFKFSPEIMTMVESFSKLHQYDDRKTYKEAWVVWSEDNREIIKREEDRLGELNYQGDVNDKMYKAGRYYFRKKSAEKKEPKNRRQYITVSGELLEAMDQHIAKNSQMEDYSPASGYATFCQEQVVLLKGEINNICKENDIDGREMNCKIKKTYKNRYFIFTKSY